MFVEYLYEKQRLEQKCKQLIARKQKLEQQLAEFHNPDAIKQFAKHELGMLLVQRKQIKKLST